MMSYKFFCWIFLYAEITIPLLWVCSCYWDRLKLFLRIIVVLWAMIVVTPVSQLGIMYLENMYPKHANLPGGAEGIILLGGFHNVCSSNVHGFPIYNGDASRFLEAIDFLQQNKGLKVLISGKGHRRHEFQGEAELSAKTLSSLGFDSSRITVETLSQNTMSNAREVAKLLPGHRANKWLLVTSAYHMKRAVMNFKQHGLEPIPYPVHYKIASIAGMHKFYDLGFLLNTYRTFTKECLGIMYLYILEFLQELI